VCGSRGAYGPLGEDALLLLGKVDRHDVYVTGRVPRKVLQWYSTFLAAPTHRGGVTEQGGMNLGQVLAKPSSFRLPLTLSRAHRRVPCHQNAQFLPDNGQVHREPIKSRLSVDASYLPRRLCISIAIHGTYFAHRETL
jgi:hypothetical protein